MSQAAWYNLFEKVAQDERFSLRRQHVNLQGLLGGETEGGEELGSVSYGGVSEPG